MATRMQIANVKEKCAFGDGYPEICSYMNFKENAQIARPFISAGHQDFFVARPKTIENLANNEPGTKEPAPFFSFYRYACF